MNLIAWWRNRDPRARRNFIYCAITLIIIILLVYFSLVRPRVIERHCAEEVLIAHSTYGNGFVSEETYVELFENCIQTGGYP